MCIAAVLQDDRATSRQNPLWKVRYFLLHHSLTIFHVPAHITLPSTFVSFLDSCIALKGMRYLSLKLCMCMHSQLSWRF